MNDDYRKYFYIPHNDVIDMVDEELKRVEYVPKDDPYHEGYRTALYVVRRFAISQIGLYEERMKFEAKKG